MESNINLASSTPIAVMVKTNPAKVQSGSCEVLKQTLI